jgi:hypothetical protein
MSVSVKSLPNPLNHCWLNKAERMGLRSELRCTLLCLHSAAVTILLQEGRESKPYLFFNIYFRSISTRVSPCGIPRDIYSVYNFFKFYFIYLFVSMLLCSCSPGVLMDSGLVLVGLAAFLRWL